MRLWGLRSPLLGDMPKNRAWITKGAPCLPSIPFFIVSVHHLNGPGAQSMSALDQASAGCR